MIVAYHIIRPEQPRIGGLAWNPPLILFDEFIDLGEAIEELQKSGKGWTIKKGKISVNTFAYTKFAHLESQFKEWVIFEWGIES